MWTIFNNNVIKERHKAQMLKRFRALTIFRCHCYLIIHDHFPAAKQCNGSVPLGMQSGKVGNHSITASSHYSKYPAWKARLNSGIEKAWYAFPQDPQPWIQVDLEKPTWLKAVATQGKVFSFYVKTYKVAYSPDEVTWFTYGEPGDDDKKVDKVWRHYTCYRAGDNDGLLNRFLTCLW